MGGFVAHTHTIGPGDRFPELAGVTCLQGRLQSAMVGAPSPSPHSAEGTYDMSDLNCPVSKAPEKVLGGPKALLKMRVPNHCEGEGVVRGKGGPWEGVVPSGEGGGCWGLSPIGHCLRTPGGGGP